MTPLLTVVVPAYNAEPYLARALDSLVGFGPEVEVLVVDDGSTDGTAALAQGYADRHPGEVHVLRKANGGHGSAINTGLDHARGEYLKVVDADDWVDRAALAQVLTTLRGFVRRFVDPGSPGAAPVDLLVSNFVYEKVGKRVKTTVRYRGALPRGRVLTWSQTRRFAKRQYMMMHALMYRTQVLRDAGLRLPEHTFYVDNLYALVPLAHVRTLYYLDVDLYRYFIGREDQSVHEAVMLKRLDQQLRVNWLMLEHVSRTPVTDRRLRRYLLHYVEIICAVSSILLVRAGTPACLVEKERLWSRLRAQDPELYHQVRWSGLGQISNLPGPAGRRVTVLAYRVAQRAIGFS
ncbi:glycosyltransferase family 2 protein [Cellulosimicrobium sp. E-16]|uniref:glycosyltransferase family 2 protein n=1 Tax=Cellulosimicrobium sp. E-16 TaxID=3404049 RepID=UPI003CEEBAA5